MNYKKMMLLTGLFVLLLFGVNSSVLAKATNNKINIQQAYKQLLHTPHVKAGYKSARIQRNAPARYQAARIAKQQLRKKYRWGGASPHTGFDCSGLMHYVYKKAHLHIPRTATEQYKYTRRVSLSKLKIGDLIFFHTRRTKNRVNHVGIYMGGGNFIHAPRRGKPVMVSKFSRYWRRKVVGAGRV